MTDEPSDDEQEAERRFNETLARMVKSPPKPHGGNRPLSDSKKDKGDGSPGKG